MPNMSGTYEIEVRRSAIKGSHAGKLSKRMLATVLDATSKFELTCGWRPAPQSSGSAKRTCVAKNVYKLTTLACDRLCGDARVSLMIGCK